MVKRFYDAACSITYILNVFETILPYCFEHLELKQINAEIKIEILNRFAKAKLNFNDLSECMASLFSKAKSNKSIEILDNLKIESYESVHFNNLNRFIEAKDELSVHEISNFMRETFLNKLDLYLADLVEFRNNSTQEFERFELELNRFLINLMSNDNFVKNHKVLQFANEILLKDTNNKYYRNNLSIYRQVINVFIDPKWSGIASPQFRESAESLIYRLNLKHHSHYVYFSTKFDYLKGLVRSFYEITKELDNFCDMYMDSLDTHYSNMTNEEAFDSKKGKLNSEILEKLTTNKSDLSDIKEVLKTFKNKNLTDSLIKIERFVPSKNAAVLAGVSAALRQLIINRTRQYAIDLLDFRSLAFVTFDQFEKAYFEYLSSYKQVKCQELMQFLTAKLKELTSLNEYHTSKRNEFISIYLLILNSKWSNSSIQPAIESLKSLLKKCGNKLNPYLINYYRNLQNLLNNYVNWCDPPLRCKDGNSNIYEINTQSAILSRIIARLKREYPTDLFCPSNEIRIINSNNLFIDVDLNGPEFQGVNLVIVGVNVKLVEEKTEFRIATDGKDANEQWLGKQASSGTGKDDQGNGKKGVDGSDGLPGGSAGHVYIVANDLSSVNILVSAKGGKGSTGQSGGDGASGKDGADGKSGDRERIEKYFDGFNWAFNVWSYRVTRVGTDGENGGNGGDAGCGGYAGESGDNGLVKLVSLNDILVSEYKDKAEDDNYNKKNGQPGKPGKKIVLF
jgi:hypothetical protein